MDIDSKHCHPFEIKLTSQARDLRTRIINASKDKPSFEALAASQNLPEVYISLNCASLQNRLIHPARTINCTHLDAVDLTLFLFFHMIEGKPSECPKCKVRIANWETEVVVDSTMCRILKEVREDCERVHYFVRDKKYFILEGQLQPHALEMFVKIQDANKSKSIDLEKIIQRITSQGGIVDPNLMIPFTCAITSKRINYPCRLKGCKHFECMDLEEFVNQYHDKQIWKCHQCTNETKTPIDDIEIDKTIQSVCLRYDKRTLEGIYASKKKQFLVNDTNNDPFLNNLIKDEKDLIEKNFKTILALSSYSPQDALKDGLLKTVLQSQGNPSEIEISLLDPAVNLLINFPARTKLCSHLGGCDVKTYLVDWSNSPDYRAKCRICQAEFSEPINEVYIDNFLRRALQKYAEKVVYHVNDDFFFNKDEKLQYNPLAKIIADNTEKSPVTYDSPRYKSKESIQFNTQCSISERLMQNPITLKNCAHPANMDREAYLRLAPDKRPEKCRFPGCGNKIIEKNLVGDLVMKDILGLKHQSYCGKYVLKDKVIRTNMAETTVLAVDDKEMIDSYTSAHLTNEYNSGQPKSRVAGLAKTSVEEVKSNNFVNYGRHQTSIPVFRQQTSVEEVKTNNFANYGGHQTSIPVFGQQTGANTQGMGLVSNTNNHNIPNTMNQQNGTLNKTHSLEDVGNSGNVSPSFSPSPRYIGSANLVGSSPGNNGGQNQPSEKSGKIKLLSATLPIQGTQGGDRRNSGEWVGMETPGRKSSVRGIKLLSVEEMK